MTGKQRLIVAGCAGPLTNKVVRSLEGRGFDCDFLDLAFEASSVREASWRIDEFIDRILFDGEVYGLVNVLAPPSNLAIRQIDFLSQTTADWRRAFDINIYGVLDVTRAVLARMCAQKSGSVVAVTSNAGLRGVPGLNAYSAAHAGMQVFTQCMAQDSADHGIRINCIITNEQEVPPCDSGGNLKQAPLGPGNYGFDVGAAAAFLLSKDASHITGSCIDVSGGWSLS
jgi:3-oxoacyl-[acyl-carrier protein] reductase